MEDFSQIMDELEVKAVAPNKNKDEIPLQIEGESKAELPKAMMFTFGDQGVSKSTSAASRYDFSVPARERFLLRKRHPFLAAVHNAIIKQAKKVELYVSVIDETVDFNEDTKKRMELFIESGFGMDGEKEFRARILDTKKWYGDSFGEIVFDLTTKEPLKVGYLIAETIRILPSETGDIIGYPQVVDGVLNHTFSPENIIHLREHADEYSFFGYSDIDALFGALLMDTLADDYNSKVLSNDASVAGALVFNDDVDVNDLDKLRWQYIIQHKNNPNKPIFLNRVKQWIPMGIDMRDMDWQELHRSVKEKIMMVYGVLPMQVAVVETGKLANPEQQLEIGAEYIRQELQTIQAAYNLKIAARFQNSENLMFEFGDLDPKPDEEAKEAATMKVWADIAKVLSTIPDTFSKDEIRELLDYEPMDDGTGADTISNPTPPVGGLNTSIPPAGGDSTGNLPPQPENDTSSKPPADNSVVRSIVARSKNEDATDVKPFAGYIDFADCVSKNQDQENPQAYCAAIMQATEVATPEKAFEIKALEQYKASRAQNRDKFNTDLNKIYARATKEIIKIAKREYVPNSGKSARIKVAGVFESAISAIFVKLRADIETSAKTHTTGAFRDAKTALGGSFNTRDERAIIALLSSSNGALDAMKAFTVSQKEGFVKVINDAYENGLDLRSMVKEMRNFADIETYRLERIARTETNRFSNQGRFSGYKELEERRGIEYDYEWVGPDDERTSEICTDIKADNPYPLDELIRVTDGGEPHINCRHNLVRLVK